MVLNLVIIFIRLDGRVCFSKCRRLTTKLGIDDIQYKLLDEFYQINEENILTDIRVRSVLRVRYSLSFVMFKTRTLISVTKGETVKSFATMFFKVKQ